MQSKGKVIGNGIFLAVVFMLTIYGVFHGEDLGAMMEAIRDVEKWKLIPGAALVFFFIWGESIILWYMMRSFGIRLKKRICFLFSSVGFFFSCITPSASGGQPMQIYYMKKEKIPIPVATVILMVVTITYKLVLVVIEKLRFLRHKEERTEKLRKAMEVYRETASYLEAHKKVILGVILITFIQRFALFAVTWVVYLSLGLTGTAMWDVVMLQAVVSVSVDMLPLPGGMGISEALFLRMFPSVFGEMLLPAMVLSRGLGYYSQLLISAVFTAVAQVYYMLRHK